MSAIIDALDTLDKGPVILCGERRDFWLKFTRKIGTSPKNPSDGDLVYYLVSTLDEALCYGCRHDIGCTKRELARDKLYECWTPRSERTEQNF